MLLYTDKIDYAKSPTVKKCLSVIIDLYIKTSLEERRIAYKTLFRVGDNRFLRRTHSIYRCNNFVNLKGVLFNFTTLF